MDYLWFYNIASVILEQDNLGECADGVIPDQVLGLPLIFIQISISSDLILACKQKHLHDLSQLCKLSLRLPECNLTNAPDTRLQHVIIDIFLILGGVLNKFHELWSCLTHYLVKKRIIAVFNAVAKEAS